MEHACARRWVGKLVPKMSLRRVHCLAQHLEGRSLRLRHSCYCGVKAVKLIYTSRPHGRKASPRHRRRVCRSCRFYYGFCVGKSCVHMCATGPQVFDNDRRGNSSHGFRQGTGNMAATFCLLGPPMEGWVPVLCRVQRAPMLISRQHRSCRFGTQGPTARPPGNLLALLAFALLDAHACDCIRTNY